MKKFWDVVAVLNGRQEKKERSGSGGGETTSQMFRSLLRRTVNGNLARFYNLVDEQVEPSWIDGQEVEL
jgi:hypothetical protein